MLKDSRARQNKGQTLYHLVSYFTVCIQSLTEDTYVHVLCISDLQHCCAFLVHVYSSTNALTGEGLEEAFQWLAGMLT